MKFKIVKEKETGSVYLGLPYFLDGGKTTVYCEYEDGVEPDVPQYGLSNFYNGELEVIGNYETDKYEVNNNIVSKN